MKAALIVLLALALVVPVAAVVPTASACIQVYPYSELCRGDKVSAVKRIACWETDVCLP